MRIAVTGANGFVGRRLMELGCAAGLTMIPVVRRPAVELPGAQVCGDFSRIVGPVDAKFSCNVLVHLAAAASPVGGTIDADDHFRVGNVDATRGALALAASAGASRFIFVSSIKAVAESSHRQIALDEAVFPEPEDAYGRSKLAAEYLVQDQALAGGIEAITVRPPMVYGPRAGGNFRMLFRLVEKGFPLPLGAVRNRRSLVYLDNLAEALIALAQAPSTDEPSRLYHVTDPEPCSTPDLIRMIAFAANRPARLWPCPVAILELAGRLTHQYENVRRLTGSLEVNGQRIITSGLWRPRYGTLAGISETVKFFANSNDQMQ